jgi:hypothetical protein
MIGPRFWLWWVIAVPLTCLTSLAMYLWTRLKIGK